MKNLGAKNNVRALESWDSGSHPFKLPDLDSSTVASRLFQTPNFRIIYILIQEKSSQTVNKKSKVTKGRD